MAGEQRRLTGEDSKLLRCTIGTAPVTDPIPAKTWVKIVEKATSGSLFDGLSKGEFYYNPTASTLALVGIDSYYTVNTTDMLDMAGWSVSITSDKIDVTTTADTTRKYRRGKADSSGSCSFVFIKGITDIAGGLLNSFFKIVDIDATGNAVVTPINTASYFLLGYLDGTDGTVGNQKLATFMEVEFDDAPLNFKMNEASNLDVNFHLTGSTNINIYRLTNV